MERQQTGLTPAALMESSGGQPDVERLPAAFGEQTVLAKTGPARSETAQYNTPGAATSDFLSPSAPPNGCSTNEAAVSKSPAPSTSTSSLANKAFVEELLVHGAQGGASTAAGTTSQSQQMDTAAASLVVGGGDVMSSGEMAAVDGEDKEPPAKRLKLDTLNGSEAQKGVELIVPLSDKPALCDDPSQLSSLISPESLLSQRTLSQSSSLSDSTNPDSSAALSPDIQTTLAQLNTSNLDIATRRNILLGRTKNKYVCDVCGRECPSKHKLKRHLSTHSEERPFICQICRKSFKWTEYLQKHMRQQHPGGVEGASSPQTPSSKSPLHCSHPSSVLSSSSQHQVTSSSSSMSTLVSPSLKSPSEPSTTDPSSLSKSESQESTQKTPAVPQTVDSGITVNMDDVLTTSSSAIERPSNSSTPKPTKQNASVGVNMDEEEELAEEAMKSTAATHLTPLEGLTINHTNLSVSVGGAHLVAQAPDQMTGSGGGDSINIISDGQVVVGSGGGGGQMGTIDDGANMGTQVDITTGINTMQMPVGRGAANGHSIAMDSSGMCYATASISQPLTTFANGSGHQQQSVMGAGGMMQGYSDGGMQTSADVGQQGNPLDQQSQQYAQDMLQHSLAVASTCAVQDPNSIPASAQYSIPSNHQQQQQQTMQQVYTDQQMANSQSMSEHDPNSMSVGGLHSMTTPDLVRDSQQLVASMPVGQAPTNTDPVMMQDMSQHMTQYTNYSMQVPMNNTMYGTESVNASIQQTSGVVPHSLGTQYPQVPPGPSPTGGPMGLTNNNTIAQTVAQNTNVYASVASYDTMGMQSQDAVGMANYSNTQQTMMVQTQTDMVGGYGVMHDGLVQTQQDIGVGVMDPSLYGSTGGGGNGGNNGGGIVGAGSATAAQGMIVDTHQQRQQQMQQQAENFISQQIKKLQSQLQSHDSLMTQMQDRVTGQQQPSQPKQQDATSNAMQQQQQQQYSTSSAQGEADESNEASDGKRKFVKVVIVHEHDPTVERFPVVQKSKKTTIEIGIQCELGPETIKSLIEEEKAMALKETQNDTLEDDDDGCNTDEENPGDRVVQKYPCEYDNCEKAYIHRKDLIRHMKIRHGQSPLKLEPVTVETREKPYLCPVGHCGRSYYHLKDLRRHQRLCHKVNLETRTTSVLKNNVQVDEDCKTQLRYPCDFPGCLRSYVHKKDLVRHKRLYHKDTASKPTIPIPVRYTDSELKRIKQEVKNEIDKSIEKIRLDSTGSNASNATASGGDDTANSSLVVEPEAELSTLTRTTDDTCSSTNLPTSEQSAVNVTLPLSTSGTGAQFVLYIDPNAPSSSATLVPATSTSTSQASSAVFTGSSPCVLPTSDALSMQNLSKAILSSMTASLPQGQAQLDSTASLLKMATGEHIDHSLISSEVASILGALEQAHFRQQQQQQQTQQPSQQQEQEQQQQQNGSSSASQSLSSLSTLPTDILGIAPLMSTAISTSTCTAPPADAAAGSTDASTVESVTVVLNEAVTTDKNASVIESLQSEMTITESNSTTSGGDSNVADSASSLHQLFTANSNQEQSKISTATESI